MASNVANKIIKITEQMPNARERAASQFGQLNGIESSHWNGDPATLADAINRLAALIADWRFKFADPETDGPTLYGDYTNKP